MLIRSAVLISALSLVSGTNVRADQTASVDWSAWLTAVDAHAAGQKDAALERVAALTRKELDELLSSFSREFTALPRERQRRVVSRALVLHTDIAILYHTPTGYTLPAMGLWRATLVGDGGVMGQLAGTFHWEFMRRVIRQLRAVDDRRMIAQTYYRASAAALQSWGEYPELTPHLAVAQSELGDDPVLLLYEGTLRQAYAAPGMQRFFRERGVSQAAAPTTGGASALRAAALAFFRRALSLDPKLVEARVRMAHIMGDSLAVIETQCPRSRAQWMGRCRRSSVYAALIMGREQRELGQLDKARAAFDRAHRIYPDATPPRYGLSALSLAEGDQSAARAFLTEPSPAPAGLDLLWARISRVHEPSATTLLDDMRRSFSAQ